MNSWAPFLPPKRLTANKALIGHNCWWSVRVKENKKLSNCCCDSRSYCVRRKVQLQNVVCNSNSRGQLVSMSIYLGYLQLQSELKSAFDAKVCWYCRLMCFVSKVSGEVNRKCSARNSTVGYNFQPSHQSWAPQCTASQIVRQTDRQTDL